DNDEKSIDLEQIDDEETDDKFVHGEKHVQYDDEETDDELYTVDAGKTEEVKDDAKKYELPPTSSSLSVSSGFADQFLKLLFDTSLISIVKDTTDTEFNSLLDIKIQSEVPHIQSPSVLRVPYTTDAPTITTIVLESGVLSVVQLRVAKLERDVSELKNIDHSAKALATLKSQVPTVVDNYLRSRLDDSIFKVLHRHTAYLIQKHSEKPTPDSSKIQTPSIELEPELEKSASKILKIK
ncbi:hypothetical protein Tco_0367447, partial [Tanacetum coccineum]